MQIFNDGAPVRPLGSTAVPLSDYIVYVDESGDHSLANIDDGYPIFVLNFCLIKKENVSNSLAPSFKKIKLSHFGHDNIVFHEKDIRSKLGVFSKMPQSQRNQIMNDISVAISNLDFSIICIVVKKIEHKKKYSNPAHPYDFSVEMGLERIYKELEALNQHNQLTHIVFEERGKSEDKDLELAFRRVCDGKNYRRLKMNFEIIFSKKANNLEGLQLSDLCARPIGLSVIKPSQANLAFDVIKTKFAGYGSRQYRGRGLKLFP